jgi:hypothetical protein
MEKLEAVLLAASCPADLLALPTTRLELVVEAAAVVQVAWAQDRALAVTPSRLLSTTIPRPMETSRFAMRLP